MLWLIISCELRLEQGIDWEHSVALRVWSWWRLVRSIVARLESLQGCSMSWGAMPQSNYFLKIKLSGIKVQSAICTRFLKYHSMAIFLNRNNDKQEVYYMNFEQLLYLDFLIKSITFS